MADGTPMLRLTEAGLRLGEAPFNLISGSVHYWRLDPGRWRELLEKARDLGVGLICSYVPWVVHERGPGDFDFSGPRDLERFCGLCAELDLPLLLRPGPHINAEITGFGFPDRIISDPALLARGPAGAPITIPAPPRSFHIPSYSCEAFFAEVAGFFDALAPILARQLAPRGPVVGLQADNENSGFFRTAAYDHDYHPEAIAAWRAWLERRLETPEAAAARYGWDAPRPFAELDPPRQLALGDAATLRWLRDWVTFKEEHMREGLLRIAALLRERCPEDSQPLMFHNYPPCDLLSSPFDVRAVERELDLQGFDLYPTRENHRYLAEQCRALAAASRLPFIPEFGTGSSPWNGVVRLEDERFTTPYVMMQGTRAINFYMWVERERWYGSPITEDGLVRPDHAALFQPLLAALEDIGLSDLSDDWDTSLIAPRAYARHIHATYLLAPVPPLLFSLAELDLGDGVAEHSYGVDGELGVSHRALLSRWSAALSDACVPFATLVDEPGEAWIPAPERRQRVICPTWSYLDGALAERLAGWAEAGAEVCIGPKVPTLDGDFEPGDPRLARLAALVESGRVRLLAEPEAEGWRPSWAAGLEGLQARRCQGRDGRGWLWLANPRGEAWEGERPALLGEASAWRWGEGRLDARLRLEPWAVALIATGR